MTISGARLTNEKEHQLMEIGVAHRVIEEAPTFAELSSLGYHHSIVVWNGEHLETLVEVLVPVEYSLHRLINLPEATWYVAHLGVFAYLKSLVEPRRLRPSHPSSIELHARYPRGTITPYFADYEANIYFRGGEDRPTAYRGYDLHSYVVVTGDEEYIVPKEEVKPHERDDFTIREHALNFVIAAHALVHGKQ